MNRAIGIAIVLCAVAVAAGTMQAAETEQPAWAYGIPTEEDLASRPPREPDDGTRFSVPGSDLTFTRAEIRGYAYDQPDVQFAPADWHPADHPAMPDVVARGAPERGVRACAFCHYPNGKGYPGTAGVAGLPAGYIAQQLRDFRDGLRQTSEPKKDNVELMINVAKGLTDEEIEAAAAYFASMQWTPWFEVVETDMVPLTWNRTGTYLPREGADAGTEPLGDRIMEIPVDSERNALRDSRAGFIAYVPVGSVEKGEDLVRTGGGKTIACATCHGETLHGLGQVPDIAARSPSYIVRQLYDMQQGTRHGQMAALMTPVVASLSAEDMLNIAAYMASLPAQAQ